MPLTASINEDLVRGMAPNEATFAKAKEIADARRFQNLGVSADGSWLLGEYQGSGLEPYQVSADFHDPNNPVLRSSSPSRVLPDKFSLALLLSYLEDANAFNTREPSEDLLIKREKKLALDEKKKSGSAAPRKINKASPDKKLAAQHEGLELLEKLLIELVAGGNWFAKEHLDKVERLAKHISDASLPFATFGLRRLILVAKQKELNDDEKTLSGAEVIAAIWTALKAVKTVLAGGTVDDALMEDVIGRPWQMAELRDKGCFQTDVSLLELAFERIDDEARQQRFEISNLLDMNSGAVHQAFANRPFKGLNQIPEQTSYTSPITVAEAAVCPGFINRRLRWEKGTEQLNENPPADFLAKAHALASADFAAALDAYRMQLQQPLAPREAVFFFRCERIGKVGDRVVIQDAAGTRIEMKDRRKDYSNASNLVRAAGMLGRDKPGVLVRLYLQSLTNMVVGLPLAAVTAKYHLRLGV